VIRKDSPKAQGGADAFLARFEKSDRAGDILTRYLKSTRWRRSDLREEIKKFEQTVEIFRPT